jgi:hypothetical protein
VSSTKTTSPIRCPCLFESRPLDSLESRGTTTLRDEPPFERPLVHLRCHPWPNAILPAHGEHLQRQHKLAEPPSRTVPRDWANLSQVSIVCIPYARLHQAASEPRKLGLETMLQVIGPTYATAMGGTSKTPPALRAPHRFVSRVASRDRETYLSIR